MNIIERILLYFVTFVCAGMLFFDHRGDAGDTPTPSQEEAVNRMLSPGDQSTPAEPDLPVVPVGMEPASQKTPQDSLVLTDSQGRPRIELRADVNGRSQINLKDEAGATIISLAAGTGNTGLISLTSGDNSARLFSKADGTLSFELFGGRRARIRMQVTKAGETEIVSSGGFSKLEAVMRTDAEGMAEFAVRNPEGGNRPSMALLPTGEASIEVVTARGQAGPVMRAFTDGLAEIAIHGGKSKSGPGMIRRPDGLSIISVRNAAGHPQASMVTSPDGTTVIAATSADGKQQASLRVDAKGKAGVRVTEPGKKPDGGKKKPKPSNNTVLSLNPDR